MRKADRRKHTQQKTWGARIVATSVDGGGPRGRLERRRPLPPASTRTRTLRAGEREPAKELLGVRPHRFLNSQL